MRYPDNLRDNGRIGFVAPSFGCATEPYKSAFNNALSKFGEMGYTLVTGPNCYEALGIGISNTPDKCGKELTEYYIADNSDVIISCGGGELMCEILDYVDFDRISEAKPKWYMGYSDNTNFTFLLNTLCDTAAIYGPCAPAFGMEPWHRSLDDAYRILKGEIKSVYSYDMWEKKSLKDEEVGHGDECLLRRAHDDGQNHDGQRERTGDHRIAPVQLGDKEQHTEQAVDDGRDALQRLGGDAHDLDELAAAAGVLHQPDGRKDAQRRRDRQREGGHQHRVEEFTYFS